MGEISYHTFASAMEYGTPICMEEIQSYDAWVLIKIRNIHQHDYGASDVVISQ